MLAFPISFSSAQALQEPFISQRQRTMHLPSPLPSSSSSSSSLSLVLHLPPSTPLGNCSFPPSWHPLDLTRKALRGRVACVSTRISTRPRRKSAAQREDARSEAEELVRSLMRKFSDKEPLVKTLNKYVRVVRTEHCFLLFEEFGKSEKWTQCLEVHTSYD